MRIQFSFGMVLCVAVASLGILTGCGPKNEKTPSADGGKAAGNGGEGVDPHDVPLTDEQKEQLRQETANFADAVAKVKQSRDAVERETKDGLPENPFEAHQALDRVDLVVQWLPSIARDSGVPKDRWQTVTEAANELRDLFEQVHQNIDNKTDPDFASVAARIDARIGELEAIAQAEPAGQ